MAKIFRYEVNYYDEYSDKELTEKGLVAAENYSDAVSKLCDTDHGYGENCLIYVKVWDLDDTIIVDSDLMIDLRK